MKVSGPPRKVIREAMSWGTKLKERRLVGVYREVC